MLNKKTQYAFQALMYLAEHKDDGPVLIADISKKEKDSPQVPREHFIGIEEIKCTRKQKRQRRWIFYQAKCIEDSPL